MIKSVVWANMLDYPGEVATTLFIGTCKWRCDFCQNIPLLSQPVINFKKYILPKLIKRKSFINHIVLSGGEATDWNRLDELINILKENKFNVGLHTNGVNPDVLDRNINKLNYIGMDIKTSPNKYNLITKSKVNIQDIIKSISIVKDCDLYEFRTTVYPKYVNKNDCIYIAKLLNKMGIRKYTLQQFSNINLKNCNIIPYSNHELIDIKNSCQKIIPTTIRGI